MSTCLLKKTSLSVVFLLTITLFMENVDVDSSLHRNTNSIYAGQSGARPKAISINEDWLLFDDCLRC